MDPLGLTPSLLVLFIGFGLMVGVFFGFFGMGGSFLVTPALLILGYSAPVAIGSSMAFVFGTAIIGTLKHQDVGDVDYKLGGVMIAGIAVGIEIGSRFVFLLDGLGYANLLIGLTYVLLLAGIGTMFIRNAITTTSDTDGRLSELAQSVSNIELPPMVTLTDGSRASIWTISGVGGVVGVVSGFLGVGGGFIRMPAIYYIIGIPLAAAVGTSLFGALITGAIGTFRYGLLGTIDFGVVTALLVGSALGARLGSAATAYVDEDDVTIYFGIMLLVASLAVGLGELATWLSRPVLDTVSFALLAGAAVFVTAIIFYFGLQGLREDASPGEQPEPSD